MIKGNHSSGRFESCPTTAKLMIWKGFAMKKVITAVVFAVALCLCFGMPESRGTILSGKIVGLTGGTCLVAGAKSDELYAVPTGSAIKIFDQGGRAADESALRPGQTVEFNCSGEIMATYPAMPAGVSNLRVTGRDDDLVGFYCGVLEELWRSGETLNADIDVMAFDLSRVGNLTAGEKGALCYLMSSAHGARGVEGTYDELVRQGSIDRDQKSFWPGVLFQIRTADAEGRDFSFSAKKWRSSLSAVYFLDCRAVKNNGSWSYTVGSRAVA